MRTVVGWSPIAEYDASSAEYDVSPWLIRLRKSINGHVEPTGSEVSGSNCSIWAR